MFTPKIWLSVGAFALAGSTAVAAEPAQRDGAREPEKTAVGSAQDAAPMVVAQRRRRGAGGEGGEGGEGGASRPSGAPKVAPQQRLKTPAKPRRGAGGEGGEGGERGSRRRGSLSAQPVRRGQGAEGGEGGEGGVNTRYIFGFTE